MSAVEEVDVADLTPAQRRALLKGGRATKYHNRRTEAHGLVFDSAAEARHYEQLLLRQAAGEIHGLRCQVHYPLVGANDETVGVYVADFVFSDQAGVMHIIDVKSKPTMTTVYRLKKKLMSAQGYEIEEVEA